MKKSLIVVNTNKQESQAVAKDISFYLQSKKIESEICSFDGFNENCIFSGYDFVITLGGDGTVLFAARGCAKLGIPVFPVNFGEFGFIASIQKNDWQHELELFLSGKSSIEERTMLQATVLPVDKNDSECFSAIGLNDVVICAKTAARTVLLDVAYNYSSLGKFKADGIIISTPTGSTAYSSSAGGPIIDPELDALVLTPINSFSLSTRPLVLSPNGEIDITVLPSREKDLILTIDGQKPLELHQGDRIKVRRINDKVKLVGCTSKRFYEALRSKLNWSGGPHA